MLDYRTIPNTHTLDLTLDVFYIISVIDSPGTWEACREMVESGGAD